MLTFKITNLDKTIASLESLTKQAKSSHEAAVNAGLLFLIEKAQKIMDAEPRLADHSEELYHSFLMDVSTEASSITGTLTNTSDQAALAEWGTENIQPIHFMQRAYTENKDELRQVMLAAVKAEFGK